MAFRQTPYIKIFLELAKVKITGAVAFSTFLGYVIFNGKINTGLILPTLGIFLLACAASALNHYQEFEYDALMERTKNRPIPSGKISPQGALMFAVFLTISGSTILYWGAGFVGLQLGILALLWYNAIYTPLKRKTPFAVIPGSFIGAIPPAVGWVAAGGPVYDIKILMVSFFFFIWQIPHFWLLAMKYGKQYESAGFPSISTIYTPKSLRNITFVWTITAAIAAMFIPMFGGMNFAWLKIVIIVGSLLLVAAFSSLLTVRDDSSYNKKYFIYINIYLLFIIFVLSVDAIAY
jgi:protoheme IX farnesyltransferase